MIRFLRAGCLGFFILMVGAIAAAVQISPGPLSKAHQNLDSTAQCSTCHKFGGGAAIFRCLECHSEIATRIAAHRGAHASFVKNASSEGCARCHSEHNGREFPLIKWDPLKFDHRQTGYALEGKHAGLACAKCHAAQHISTAERATIKMKDLSKTFLGLSTGCVACHEDAHKGRLGTNCSQCHNFQDWKNVASQFDHAKTRYPLNGLHAQVKCEKCHTAGPDGKTRFAGIPFGKCNDCHSDPHKGTFQQQSCQSCHNTSGWKKVAAAQLGIAFDHSKTKFPLQGKHQTVGCGQCHLNGDFKKPLVFGKCMDCHKPDPHQGQFAKRPDGGECAACHTVEGWKPSKFTVKEHASTLYPLQGKHAALECAQCHIPKGKETQFKIKFQRCTDCHRDEHQAQFAAAPHFNKCEDCHGLQGYKPSTFTLARHQETRFLLTGGHVATPCVDCHKNSTDLMPPAKTNAQYHFDDLSCTRCHQNPHRDQFKKRMEALGPEGKPLGCNACHTTKTWKELSKFDHAQTSFPLVGAHRAVACIDCHKPANLETRLLNVDFTSAPTKCEECHADVHGRQFANARNITPCAECHNTGQWRPSTFDHDLRASFQLQGAHKRVRCGDCHKLTKLVDAKKVLFYKPTPKDCAACHAPDVAARPLGQ